MQPNKWIRWFEDLTREDVDIAGGKNAALGELMRGLKAEGVEVPGGFAVTTHAYRHVLESNLLTASIERWLYRYHAGRLGLRETGKAIRELIEQASLPPRVVESVREAYSELARRCGIESPAVAIRSSATAEDLPEASFAGQQETYLNIRGEHDLLPFVLKAMASLFTDRAIAYREMHGVDHLGAALSVGVQQMVRADLGGAGVLFTLDTETGFPNVIVIDASWGLGEYVVKGVVNPDQYLVFKGLPSERRLRILEKTLGSKDQKLVYTDRRAGDENAGTEGVPTTLKEQRTFVLSDEEILQLARWGLAIEEHFGRPMDVEWAKDGQTGKLYILQARPETVHSHSSSGALRTYTLRENPAPLLSGLAVGNSIAAGTVVRVDTVDELPKVSAGCILVTRMTDPDWVPAMRQAAAIVTELGGRTCHAAIVSREIGVPAVVGADRATELLNTGDPVTVSCAAGEKGLVYSGLLEFDTHEIDLASLPQTRTSVMLNLAQPESAMRWWRLPSDGVGLARMEFIISEWIRVHPMALVRYDGLEDAGLKARIDELTAGYPDGASYFVERLAGGIARLAAPHYPKRVIVRMSDFKTNEYANLIGGKLFEPEEDNPMIGWRGASRYYSSDYRQGFALECKAIRRAREELGLKNIAVMIPFCRTVEEADLVLAEMAKNELRHEDGLEIFMMCEIPSNVVLADEFAPRFDGFSIGSNDLTQLVLGIDRDSSRLSYMFDERNEAVKRLIRSLIPQAHAASCTVGICGEAPSNYPDFVDFLVEAGIDSISVEPDSFALVKSRIAAAETKLAQRLVHNALQPHRSQMLLDEFGHLLPDN